MTIRELIQELLSLAVDIDAEVFFEVEDDGVWVEYSIDETHISNNTVILSAEKIEFIN
jgi:hypothetical protein